MVGQTGELLLSRTLNLRAWGWPLAIIGTGSLANAVWMIFAPGHWYTELPAGVPDYGPLNEHFVRDIGVAFAAAGVALVWAAFSSRYRLPLVAIGAVFFWGHALLHVYDTLRGAVEANHWLLDVPGVYLPAVVLAIAVVVLARGKEEQHAT